MLKIYFKAWFRREPKNIQNVVFYKVINLWGFYFILIKQFLTLVPTSPFIFLLRTPYMHILQQHIFFKKLYKVKKYIKKIYCHSIDMWGVQSLCFLNFLVKSSLHVYWLFLICFFLGILVLIWDFEIFEGIILNHFKFLMISWL